MSCIIKMYLKYNYNNKRINLIEISTEFIQRDTLKK